jgi:ribosomal 50S subunit-associated protein YjgA (DUF615 family)
MELGMDFGEFHWVSKSEILHPIPELQPLRQELVVWASRTCFSLPQRA